MDAYDSDSSLSDAESGVSTNVLLGYASKEPTGDDFSQLGGEPSWLDPTQHPPPTIVQCKTCNSYMSLLLQLNGDLPDRFPGHERRLYIWTCRRKACRRKAGSVRAFRGVRVANEAAADAERSTTNAAKSEDVGAALFGAKPSTASGDNPFSTSTSSSAAARSNPFSTAPDSISSLAAKPPQEPSPSPSAADLPATFAEKARISTPSSTPASSANAQAPAPWPARTAFPKPFSAYHLDAEYEYVSADSAPPAPGDAERGASNGTHAAFLDQDAPSTSGTAAAADDGGGELPDSAHDRTFQAFADRAAQNPEQVLRYEFCGAPLLYSRADDVGRLFAPPAASQTGAKVTTAATEAAARIPRCGSCGANRVFELQLMPHAIAELEAEEEQDEDGDGRAAGEKKDAFGEGMEWGSVLLGVCSRDCSVAGGGGAEAVDAGTVSYVEEWAGVQWEEVVVSRAPNASASR